MTTPTSTPLPDAAALVAKWRKAMEGVPGGPWIDGMMGQSEADGEIYYVRSEACSALMAMTEGPDIAMACDHLVAQHIRRCSPPGISALLDLIEHQAARLEAAYEQAKAHKADSDHHLASLAAAEAEKERLTDRLEQREDAALAGLVSDIAREIESHDAFDCPEGWTYVRAADAIATRLVERFGTRAALSPMSKDNGNG